MDEERELRDLLVRAADDLGAVYPPSVELFTRRNRRRRLVVAVLAPACAALLIVALAVVLVTRNPHRAAPPASKITVDQLRAYRWTTAPLSPLRSRSGEAAAWTGSQLILWGGEKDPGNYYRDGAAYDPATKTWSMLPASPLSARTVPLSVWTGHELFVWGGNGRSAHRFTDGAAYDPDTKRWTKVTPAPVRGDYLDGGAYLFGTKVLLLTQPRRAPYATIDASLYDPAKNTWQPLPSLHANPTHQIQFIRAVVGGDRLYLQLVGNHLSIGVGGYVLDTSNLRWSSDKVVPPRGTYAMHLFWTGTRVVQTPVFNSQTPRPGVSTDPATGASTRIAQGPLDSTDSIYAWTGGALIGASHGRSDVPAAGAPKPGYTAAWDPATNTWTALRSAAGKPGADSLDTHGGVWTGSSLLVWTDLNHPGHLTVLQFAAP